LEVTIDGETTGLIAGAVLTFGMGAVNAEETPEILCAVDYQAMSKLEMSSITGEHRSRIRKVNVNTNQNTFVNQNIADAIVAAPPIGCS
jgi:hypothetical protein